MLLLHLGIPPSGHGYAPPIAVAKITVLAKKGLYSAELHLRVYYSSRRRLSKKLSVNGEKTVLASQPDRRKHGTSPELSRPPLSRRRNGAANMKQHISLFLPSLKLRFQKTVVASRPSNSNLLHFPRFPEYFFAKRKRRKGSLNIREWASSLLFPVELVVFLTMFPLVEKVGFVVPADGAVNQAGDVFFRISGFQNEILYLAVLTGEFGNEQFHE